MQLVEACVVKLIHYTGYAQRCLFRWPHVLSCRTAAARLLRLQFESLRGAWMSVVSVVCCQVEVSATI